ncbi:MAG TPA: type II CAAX endopeptidase family protein [Spirochaetia bacterium]
MRRTTVVLEMVLFFLAFFLPGYLAQAWGPSIGPVSSSVLLQSIVTGLPQLLLMAYVVGVRGLASSPRWGFVPWERGDTPRVATLVAGCFAIVLVSGSLLRLLPPSWSRALGDGFRWGLQSPWQIPLALVFGLAAGYREEFFFRAYLLGRLAELDVSLPVASVGSVLLFSLGHVYEGPLAVIVTAAIGALFTVSYVKRRSIHVIALSHGLYNAIALSLSIFLRRALPGGDVLRILSP